MGIVRSYSTERRSPHHQQDQKRLKRKDEKQEENKDKE